RQRENIDDSASGGSQYRYESLGYVISAKENHGQQPFERGTIAQIILERDAGVVDEDVQSVDLLGGHANLCGVRDVEHQRRDAAVSVKKRLARAGIDPLRASPQRFVD